LEFAPKSTLSRMSRLSVPSDSDLDSPARARRVRAEVALVLLRTLKDQDRPEEILQDEDVTITMPRRLGLSDVIDAQIRRYKDDARRGLKMGDSDLRDLIRLVTRRPDSQAIFHRVGDVLAGGAAGGRGWARVLPRKMALSLGARRMRRRLKDLFGRPIGRPVKGKFALEVRDSILLLCDPGGHACALVSGMGTAFLSRTSGRDLVLNHDECQALEAPACRWRVVDRAELEIGLTPAAGPEVDLPTAFE